MKKIVTVIVTILLTCLFAFSGLQNENRVAYADAPNAQWVKSVGGSNKDCFNSVIQTKDGDYVAVGYSYSPNISQSFHGCDDAIIAKFDPDGKQEWLKNFGGTDEDVFTSVQETKSGDYIVVGYSDSKNGDLLNGDFTTLNKGGTDGIIAEISSEGKLQWIQSTGGGGRDEFDTLQTTNDQGYIVTGFTNSTNGDMEGNKCSYNVPILVKFNSIGMKKWIRIIDSPKEHYQALQQMTDDSYIAAGYLSGVDLNNTYSPKGYMAILRKFNSSGYPQWVKSIGGSSYDEFYSVQPTSAKGYIAVGETSSNDGDFAGKNHGQHDGVIVKFDALGNTQWTKTWGGSANDGFYSVQPTQDDGFIIAGYTESSDGDLLNSKDSDDDDAIIVKFDSNGNQQWLKTLDGKGSDKFDSAIQTKDQGYVAVGMSNSKTNSSSGNYAAIIAKFN
ncbi:hypothetical protein REC12_00495 [Desulfosporosinus sp. PR]|uniref:hypothetical protein n=1 Tax=Candidatus Desulfosporosinus nitrosoreducens TaxID=3401928 RepID=UPI0027EFE12C|nr:hypothetical protein [Desulfosporosinus sp. PR]MDQ7092073.1 hypothetical protein [Desulfosporosinus sp. PR]